MTDTPTNSDWASLHNAIRDGDLKAATVFFDTFGNARLSEPVPGFERPALHVCARWSRPEIAEMLIARGADPHQETDGFQPVDMLLDCARNEDSVKLFKIFLREGSDPNRVRAGSTPLIYVIQKTDVAEERRPFLCEMIAAMMLAGGDPDKIVLDNFGVARAARAEAEKRNKPELALALDAVNQTRIAVEKAGDAVYNGVPERVTVDPFPVMKKIPFNQAVKPVAEPKLSDKETQERARFQSGFYI